MSRNVLSQAAVVVLLMAGSYQAQVVFSGPEGVVFDTLYHRYLIANWDGRTIVQIDEHGDSSYFATFTPRIGGLRIVGSRLYGAAENEIVAYDLATRSLVVNVPIPGANLLNALVVDTSGYLYVSDGSPNRIYRMRLSDGTWSVFVDNDPMLPFPIGLFFEPETNRLLVTARPGTSAAIRAVSLPDGVVSDVLTTATCPPFAYITQDNAGRYLMSCFSAGYVVRCNHDFTGPVDIVLTHYAAPTQLFYNKLVDTLVVPDYAASTVHFVSFRDEDLDGVEDALDNCPATYNPEQADADNDGRGDSCDNCPSVSNSSQNNTDSDGMGDACDPDDDNDGVPDVSDSRPLNPFICADVDNDGCEDCGIGVDGFGPLPDNLPGNDGTDTDADGMCDASDPDDDNDGVSDGSDNHPLDPFKCAYADNDVCDDCSIGVDGYGPLPDNLPGNDGPDADADGICDASDNCPTVYNPDQIDSDYDNIGDACCCLGRVGDANGSGTYPQEVTIGDIQTLVTAKFILGTCDGIVPCLAEGDANQSGGVNPDCDDITISDIQTLVNHLFIAGPANAPLRDCT